MPLLLTAPQLQALKADATGAHASVLNKMGTRAVRAVSGGELARRSAREMRNELRKWDQRTFGPGKA